MKNNKIIALIYKDYMFYLNKILYSISPKSAANKEYKKFFKKNIDWDSPKNLIEKIFWLQFNSDTSLWTKYADKYLVREFVKEKGYENYLPKLYGKWDNPNDINFDELPERFVLKSNNGCGTVIVAKDKLQLDYESTIKQLTKWLKRPFGYSAAQSHYLKIKPCIIAEEFLENTSENSSSIVDYKIWCFNGEPESILVVSDRLSINDYSLSFYNLNWTNISNMTLTEYSKNKCWKNVDKPDSLDKMLEIAKSLSKGFPQVRVDFYDIDGHPYFGEMTFTTGFGYCTENYYNYLGAKVDLSVSNRIS